MDPLDALFAGRRRMAVGAAAVALAVLIGLGAAVGGGSTPTGFDRVVRDWLAGWLGAGPAQAFSDFGSLGVMVAVIALAASVFAVRRWFRGVVLVVVSPAISVAVGELVCKPLFHRTSGLGLAYPSGHTAAVSAVAFTIVLTTAFGPGRSALSPARAAIPVVASTLGVLMCMAGLVVAGYHYATDTIGGAALSLATVLLVALAIDAIADRLARRAAPSRANVVPGQLRASSR